MSIYGRVGIRRYVRLSYRENERHSRTARDLRQQGGLLLLSSPQGRSSDLCRQAPHHPPGACSCPSDTYSLYRPIGILSFNYKQPYQENYYHFVVESLPRLIMARDIMLKDPSIQLLTRINKPFIFQVCRRNLPPIFTRESFHIFIPVEPTDRPHSCSSWTCSAFLATESSLSAAEPRYETWSPPPCEGLTKNCFFYYSSCQRCFMRTPCTCPRLPRSSRLRRRI